jgi:hypothetical protein
MRVINLRKIIALIATAAICVSLLAACGSDETVDTAEIPTSDQIETPDEGVESEAADGRRPGTGFVQYEGSGEYNPDITAKITRSARPVRRIVKQDIYGRELSEDFYFYRNMLNTNEQRLYDQIYANAVEFDPYFEIASKVPAERIQSVYMCVRYDNPDLFWLEHSFDYTWDGNGNISSITLHFFDMVDNLDAFKQQFYACADSVAEYVMNFDSDIDKIKYCHDLLTNINTYNLEAPMNQSAYSALCTGQTVCAGFAHAFTYLMQRLGIPTASVYGNAYWPGPVDAGPHLWNLVFIDGDYYDMDVTWDNYDTYPDTDPTTYSYDYFNRTTYDISGDHVRNEPSTRLPTANGVYYSYANYYDYSPGSDFNTINYGAPGSSALPHIYPGEETSAPNGIGDFDENDADDDAGQDGTDGGDYDDEEYYDFYDWTDEQWDELWTYMEEVLTPEEMEYIDNMDWDEFLELMNELLRE